MGLDYAILFRLMESSGAIILLLRSLPVALPQPAVLADVRLRSLFSHRERFGSASIPLALNGLRKTNLGAGDGNPAPTLPPGRSSAAGHHGWRFAFHPPDAPWLASIPLALNGLRKKSGAGDGNPFHPGTPAPSFKAGRPR